MTRKSSLSLNTKSRADTPVSSKQRVDWLAKDGPGPFVIALFVVDYNKYVGNKASAMRRWVDVLKSDSRLQRQKSTPRLTVGSKSCKLPKNRSKISLRNRKRAIVVLATRRIRPALVT